MACFDNYILVRGACGTATPSTGLYINDLPGVTLKKAANISDEEKVTGVNLLNDSVTLGIELTKKDIQEAMADVVRFNSIYTAKQYGDLDYDTYLATAAGTHGITSELDCNCRLLRQFVPRIDVLLNTTISGKTISIVDGPTTTNYTLPDVTAGGLVSVYPNYEAVNETISILIDRSDVSVSETDFGGTCLTCNQSCERCSCDCNLQILSTGAGTYGLRPTIEVICSEDAFFCEINKFMARAVWYKAGMLFIDELLLSHRINSFTLYDTDRAQDAKEEWKEEYDQCVKNLIQKLPKYFETVDSCCVECNSSRWVTAHP